MTHTVPPGLADAVQANCHIADARHAADMTLCTYLLQMREFHRWERGLPFGAALARDAVGAWIAEREALWSEVEDHDYRPLPLRDSAAPGDGIDPFDVATINDRLRPLGLLYGAGLVGAERPVFFLAELHQHTWRDGVEVAVAGRELARGLLAPPAALGHGGKDRMIVLRRESLARWCWEKFEVHALRRPAGGAFAEAVQAYGLDRDFEAALPRWLDEQVEVALLHELGEVRAGRWLDPDWASMRLALPTRRADLYARAVRDHLADVSVTLPTLLERRAEATVHVWFANYDGVRELLFPSLKAGYAAWLHGDGGHVLRQAVVRGEAHFTHLARQVLALHAGRGEPAGPAIERLLTSPAAVCPG